MGDSDLPKLWPRSENKWFCNFLRSWFWIGEDCDLFFLLFLSPSKIIEVGLAQITFPCTNPFFLVDYTRKSLSTLSWHREGSSAGCRLDKLAKLWYNFSLSRCKSKRGCFCNPEVLERGSSTKVIIKKPKGERADSAQHNTVYRRVIENGWCHKLCN